jgi:hypothetical protein
MNAHNQFQSSLGEVRRLTSVSQIGFLLDGLERQKEELGPIAFELIDLLHRLGVGSATQPPLPQVNSEP